jgi:hypothetical protein
MGDWMPEVKHCWACKATARKAKQMQGGDTAGVYILTAYDPGGDDV